MARRLRAADAIAIGVDVSTKNTIVATSDLAGRVLEQEVVPQPVEEQVVLVVKAGLVFAAQIEPRAARWMEPLERVKRIGGDVPRIVEVREIVVEKRALVRLRLGGFLFLPWGSGNWPSVITRLDASLMTIMRCEAVATIFSRSRAPPPPFTRPRSGATSSAPSMVTARRGWSSSVVSGTPAPAASRAVASEVGTATT